MKRVLDVITKNVLLVVAGFVACLIGNWFVGALIGMVAGAGNCIFNGDGKGRDTKALIMRVMPAALVIGFVCAVGGQMAGGLGSFTGWVTTIVTMGLCVVVGSFMSGSKLYEDTQKPQTQAPTSGAQPSMPAYATTPVGPQVRVDATQPLTDNDLAALFGTGGTEVQAQQVQQAQANTLYDLVISENGNNPTYEMAKKLTGKPYITQRVLDEAFDKLPSNFKEGNADTLDRRLLAIANYAYNQVASQKSDEFIKTVQKLSGEDDLSEATIAKAYKALPLDVRADLPDDPRAAIMLFANGLSYSQISADLHRREDKAKQEHQDDINRKYLAIPVAVREFLPEDKEDAVNRYYVPVNEPKRFIHWYKEKLTLEQRRMYQENLLLACANLLSFHPVVDVYTEELNEFMLQHLPQLLDMFDDNLPAPLNRIPIPLLNEILPRHLQKGNPPEDVRTNAEWLASLFSCEIVEPYRRIPVTTLWKTLDKSDRAHPNNMVVDIQKNMPVIEQRFNYNGIKDIHYLMLPYSPIVSVEEMFKKLEKTISDISTKDDNSHFYHVLMNIDICDANSAAVSTSTIDSITENEIEHAYKCTFEDFMMSRFMKIPYVLKQTILSESIDITDISSLSEEDVDRMYLEHYVNDICDPRLTFPLNTIPTIMFQYMIKDQDDFMEQLNYKPAIAICKDYALSHELTLLKQFNGNDICNYKTQCPMFENVDWDEALLIPNQRFSEDFENIIFEDLWRLWINPNLMTIDADTIMNTIGSTSAYDIVHCSNFEQFSLSDFN